MNDFYLGISILIASILMFLVSNLNQEECIKNTPMKLDEIQLDFDKPIYPLLKEPLFDDNFKMILPEDPPKIDKMIEKSNKINKQSDQMKNILKIKKANQNALHINEKEKRL